MDNTTIRKRKLNIVYSDLCFKSTNLEETIDENDASILYSEIPNGKLNSLPVTPTSENCSDTSIICDDLQNVRCLRNIPAKFEHYQMHEKEIHNELIEKKTKYEVQDTESSHRFLGGRVGEIVWAKLGSSRWWPAMVIWGGDCGRQSAHVGRVWIFWFGDHNISELPKDRLSDFVELFDAKFSETSPKSFIKGIIEALKVLTVRAHLSDIVSDSGVIQWAKNGFQTQANKAEPFMPDQRHPYPESVQVHLNRIREMYLSSKNGDKTETLPTRVERQEQNGTQEGLVAKVRQGVIDITEICIACDSADAKVVDQHPLFEGGLCQDCKSEIIDSMFAYGEDGTNVYCVICGNAGILLICDNNECNRCYCTGCIDALASPAARNQAEGAKIWICYLCQDSEADGLIKRKVDWQQNVIHMFQPNNNIDIPSMDVYKDKRPIRVLSLFDGIGTGKLCLDQLGFDIEVYYASEIDTDAKNVVSMHYGSKVIHIGDIEHISDTQIVEMCPIDLIIGGSPCNDLSLVNPARKGLYDPSGTGRLFFDFFRILKTIQISNNGRHVFWFYENVASMPREYKRTINRFFQCEPSLVDAKFFSAQSRARYFWGNIPGMYSPLPPYVTDKVITLNEILTPGCNRQALVEKIRTVTTRSASLKQGNTLPVIMNGNDDMIWVTELERVFGFPDHYTDVGNLQLGRRQQLLGKSWSVPVVKHLLTPLKNFFKISFDVNNAAVQTNDKN